ncbi:MAG TPA: AarF/UbiB family protein, partial [Pyrinomonadaceae bacterium]|nr:AarF/UbiB family protein [Pyrinomonadaceae bacterium]
MKISRLLFRFIHLSLLLIYFSHQILLLLFLKNITQIENSIDEKLGKIIADFCLKAGGAFIKIGQILGTRYDIFSVKTLLPLQQLQDDVPPVCFSKIETIIESNLGRKLDRIFADFNRIPIASASISQVYRARLKHNDQLVAVKALSPKIRKIYETDIFLIGFFINKLKRFRFFQDFPLIEAFEQIADSLLNQTDFLLEAANNKKFRDGFNPLTKTLFPKIINEFSTSEILVLDFFDDLKKVGDLSERENKKLVIHALKALYRMIFLNGFIHCDLHQSNFFRFKEDLLVLLDTGFAAEIENDVRISFCEFFESVVQNNAKRCALIIRETALKIKEDFDSSEFEKEIAILLNKYSAVDVRDFQVSQFVLNLFKIQKKYGIYSTAHFTLPILSMLV